MPVVHKRRRRATRPTQSDKASLPPDVLPHIDAALKQTKVSSRALRPILSTFNDELLVLHRLFYRGNNQHRTAIFWQRVSEMRRYAERLEELHLTDILDSLRLSFFDQSQQQSSKLLKGSWTHYPDQQFVSYILERVGGSLLLVQKMHERLCEAYRSFTLAIQTGAFAQLLLTLAAIASRMSTITAQLIEILQQSLETIHALLAALYDVPSAIQRRNNDPLGTAISHAQPTESEDTGIPIQRRNPHIASNPDLHPPRAQPISAVSVERVSKQQIRPIIQEKRAKKRRKIRDEIDDIFG
ncbi:DUF4477 domain-containing protein [Mycena kentingensis (nom. inval.)]|nr:DUF4477 domain-containing protein [Mycena kentingensis (nom. inval.)]